MEPTPIPDLGRLVPTVAPGNLALEYRALSDYWRRLASNIANSIDDPLVDAIYFDPNGQIVAVRAGDVDYMAGQAVTEPPGWRWWCTKNAAAELDNHAKWAEFVWAEYIGVTRVCPQGEMPHRVARGVQQAREAAEHAARGARS